MITYGFLSPHPPVLIREIGGARCQELQATLEAMHGISRELLATEPECIVFLTPHGNVFQDCITYLNEERLEGDLGDFGQRNIRTSLPNDQELLESITELVAENGLEFIGIDAEIARRHNLNARLDHGILVPLYFLQQAGMGELPILAISIGLLDNHELYQFGQLIQEASNRLGRRIAIVASGDMSHALKEEGPYTFNPDGPRFDQIVKQALSTGDFTTILQIPSQLRENARECGYPSLLILLGAMDGRQPDKIMLNYEGPFGVGYLTAGFQAGEETGSLMVLLENQRNARIAARRAGESPLVRWARLNLESSVRHIQVPRIDNETEFLLEQRAAAFVSIKKQGQLRGCIGTFLPSYKNLAEEIAHNALAAGQQDPRFSPVQERELAELEYSVDVLGRPESCTRDELDPQKYGVIVTAGSRRGLLLPDLEGVDMVAEQLRIACQKAGISPLEAYSIERFEVQRFI